MERVHVLIAGGGVIGTSIACALAERGVHDVAVVDVDLRGIHASSELNAGGVRATWWQRVNIESCRDTLAYFAAHAQEIGLRAAGYLWLYDDAALFARAIERRELQAQLGVEVELLDRDALLRRFPFLDRSTGELVGATFSPGDGLVNPNAVRQHYRARAEAAGVRFLDRHWIEGIDVSSREPGSRRIGAVRVVEIARSGAADASRVVERALTRNLVSEEKVLGRDAIAADVFVNALGAWSPVFSSRLGVGDVSRPVRRQIALVDPDRSGWPAGVDLASLGMIVDSSRLYFHPEGSYVLAGYSEPAEPSGYDFRYDGDAFFEGEIWPRLAHRMSAFERCRHVRGWSGLYSVTPDCSGILGRVCGFSNLIEAHSFTGRGVMQSRAVGVGVAELLCDGAYGTLDLSPLDAGRFRADPPVLVREDLHI